jgi:Glycosyltransferase family 87
MGAAGDDRSAGAVLAGTSHVPWRGAGTQDPRWTLLVAAGSAVAAAVIACYPLTLPHLLAGVHGFSSGAGYDDGVYLAAALRLVNGDLPYRDFAFVHPPGIALLMAPLAGLSRIIGERDALALARVATVLVAAANSALASLSVRHHGIAASVTAGVLLAGFPGAYNADHTLLLEPWLVLFCLLAFVVLFPRGNLASSARRLGLAGALAGFAGTVKVWAILVVLPLLIVCAIVRRRRALPFLAGMVAGFVLPCLPFLVLSPTAFIRDVVLAQAERSSAGGSVDAATRISIMSGLKHFGGPAAPAVVIVLGVLFAAAVAAALGFGRRHARAADWSAAAVATAVVTGLFLPSQFYDHYAYFSAAFIAVLIGVAAGMLAASAARMVRTRSPVAARRLMSAGLPVTACGLVLLALGHGVGQARSYFADAADPGVLVAATMPAGSCAVFDDPVLVIVGNRLGTPHGNCPPLVDPFGLWLTEDAGAQPHLGGPFPQAFVDKWSSWLKQADYLVLSVPGSDYLPFSPDLIHQFNTTYRLVGAGGHAYIYARIQ